MISQETNSRSFLKAVTYRLFSMFITSSIVFGVTRQGWLAFVVTFADSFIKLLFYYLHERAWSVILYGRGDYLRRT